MDTAEVTSFKPESPKQSDYEIRHREIISRYGSDLPAGLDHLRTVTVVPSLAELSNDNFWRLLRSLSTQKNVDQRTVAILLVINNSQSAIGGEKPNNNYEGNSSQMIHDRYLENQKHLQLLREINRLQVETATAPDATIANSVRTSIEHLRQSVEISDWEAKLIMTAVRNGTQIFGVDCSSVGRAFAPVSKMYNNENPIGKARDIGGHLADELFRRGGSKHGLIDFLDGDCFVSPEYYFELQQLSDKYPNRVIVKPMVAQPVDIPFNISEKKNPTSRLASLVVYLTTSITHIRNRYLLMSSRSAGALGGPQLAVPSSIFQEINGYPTRGTSEDFVFSHTLSDDRFVKEMTFAAKVYLSDRGRVGSTDGSGRGNALPKNVTEQDTVSPIRKEVSEKIEDTLSSLLEQNSRYEKGANSKDYLRLRKQEFHLESLRRKIFIQYARRLIGEVCDIINKHEGSPISPAQVIDAIPNLNSRYKDFLHGNPLLVELIITAHQITREGKEFQVRRSSTSPANLDSTMTMELISRCLPEYFSQPTKSEPSYAKTTAALLSGGGNIRDYIHIASAAFKFRSKYTKS